MNTRSPLGFPENTFENKDSYISIDEAIKHACAHAGVNLNLKFIDTEKDIDDEVKQMDGILLTPGFGFRGVEGMIHSAEIAIAEKIPFLGICFGCQLFYVAFMRQVMGLEGANSTEIDLNTPIRSFP